MGYSEWKMCVDIKEIPWNCIAKFRVSDNVLDKEDWMPVRIIIVAGKITKVYSDDEWHQRMVGWDRKQLASWTWYDSTGQHPETYHELLLPEQPSEEQIRQGERQERLAKELRTYRHDTLLYIARKFEVRKFSPDEFDEEIVWTIKRELDYRVTCGMLNENAVIATLLDMDVKDIIAAQKASIEIQQAEGCWNCR